MTNSSITVAIQGEVGSYSDTAARRYFGEAYEPRCKDTFEDLFGDVSSGEADYGLSAVENSLVGSITSVYDLLCTTEGLTIVGETYLGIHHSLIGLPGAQLADITDVYSHPVALGQCTEFLKHELLSAVTHPANDTAGSAVFIKQLGQKSAAAIAAAPNAARLGLQILREGIENNQENCTRFLILARSGDDTAERRRTADKTSLLITHLDSHDNDLAPGILHRALGCFADQNIPLTKIESRPVAAKPWHYVFYLDCLAGAEDPAMQEALQSLTNIGATWRELGTYRRGSM